LFENLFYSLHLVNIVSIDFQTWYSTELMFNEKINVGYSVFCIVWKSV